MALVLIFGKDNKERCCHGIRAFTLFVFNRKRSLLPELFTLYSYIPTFKVTEPAN